MYTEIRPSNILADLVDSFWVFSGNSTSEEVKILPDTCTDLVFDLKQNRAFVSGIMSRFEGRRLAKEANLIGVRFQAERFGFLSEIPLSEIKNLRVDLSQILRANSLDQLSEIYATATTNARIQLLEQYLMDRLMEGCKRHDEAVLAVAKRIRASRGNVKIKDFEDFRGLGLRQLERRFKKYIGLTIKEFSNIVRFENAKAAISTFPKTSLLAIAFDAGYFDHSHMNKEFNRISGENPFFFR